MTERWVVHTTDDRFGDGKEHPYVVDGVVSSREDDNAIHLFGKQGLLGSFPKCNIKSINKEDAQ